MSVTRYLSRMIIWAALFCIVLPVSAFATPSRDELIRQMELSGQSETENERRALEVKDCLLSTYFWVKLPREGWLLWDLYQIPMQHALLHQFNDGRYFLYSKDPPEAFIVLEAKDGVSFTVEAYGPGMAAKSSEMRPSPRGDGTTHFYREAEGGFIFNFGPDALENSEKFTRAFQTYVQSYCTFTG